MNAQIISALIGAGATIVSVILAFLLNQIAKKISEKRFRKKHNIRDISGDWKSKWIYLDENGEEIIIECLDNITMKGKNCFEGEGKGESKKWHYSIAGTISRSKSHFMPPENVINKPHRSPDAFGQSPDTEMSA